MYSGELSLERRHATLLCQTRRFNTFLSSLSLFFIASLKAKTRSSSLSAALFQLKSLGTSSDRPVSQIFFCSFSRTFRSPLAANHTSSFKGTRPLSSPFKRPLPSPPLPPVLSLSYGSERSSTPTFFFLFRLSRPSSCYILYSRRSLPRLPLPPPAAGRILFCSRSCSSSSAPGALELDSWRLPTCYGYQSRV